MNTANCQNVSNPARVARIVAGLGLIGVAFAQTGPIGAIALLPLIAVRSALLIPRATLEHFPTWRRHESSENI